MTEHSASRTLVKSPPELWAECSDPAALTRHLDQFGEIKITRLEPETAVAWEGEQVRGTVRLEPSGWGTKVTLTAVAEAVAPVAVEPVAVEPVAVEPVAVEPEPVAVEPVAVEPEPVAVEPEPVAVEPDPVVSAPPPGEPKTAAPENVAPEKRPGLFGRLLAMLVGKPEPEPEIVLRDLTAVETPEPVAPAPVPEPVAPAPEPVAPAPEPVAPTPEPVERAAPPPLGAELADAEAGLVAALDSLGQAHHRPFSRG
jgi:hypothetical protein